MRTGQVCLGLLGSALDAWGLEHFESAGSGCRSPSSGSACSHAEYAAEFASEAGDSGSSDSCSTVAAWLMFPAFAEGRSQKAHGLVASNSAAYAGASVAGC